jgi:transaldolase
MNERWNPLLALKTAGQSVWLDSIRRGHILSGDLRRLVQEDGISGETSNPAIFEKAIVGSSDYDGAIAQALAGGQSALQVYETLAVEDVRLAAAVLRDVYDQTAGADGYVSLEVSPRHAYDTAGTIAEARRLWARVDRFNLMVKIPATPEGLRAVEQCLYEGINVNVTLLFAVPVYEEVAWTYIRALERRVAEGQPIHGLASVASFFVSRIDTLADRWIAEKSAATKDRGFQAELASLEGRTAIANAKRAYQRFRSIFSHPRFLALATKGARVQRPLWASTSTKDPRYSDVLYVETLVGPDTVTTLPFETIDAFRDHGKVRATIEEDVEGAERTLDGLEKAGICLKDVTDEVLREGVAKFAEPFEKLIRAIERKREAAGHASASRAAAG